MFLSYVLNNRRILAINHSLKVFTLNRVIEKVVYGKFNYNFFRIRRKVRTGIHFTYVRSRVVRACAYRPVSGLQLLEVCESPDTCSNEDCMGPGACMDWKGTEKYLFLSGITLLQSVPEPVILLTTLFLLTIT
jgi:hypothetical protein